MLSNCHLRKALNVGVKHIATKPKTNIKSMDSKITFRLSKSGQTLFKSKSYQISINGNIIGKLDNEMNTISKEFPMGKYSIEVGENDFFIRKDIVLAVGQMETFTINPSFTYTFFRGFLIGIAILTIFFQFIILDKISIPLMFIPLIPLVVLGRKNYGESFALTISKT